ncbi:MAG: CYTH domain-containing protein [Lachnospiraceae bacterium]|jgi:CYTH domain-containing protein|nr:CYTH domain-containing protein [Lachnospiraceae bacterium]
MEIEKKYTIKQLPDNLEAYDHHDIEQAYLNTDPVVRIRKEDETYYLTYKGAGLMAREEYNLPLNRESYYHLRDKVDGNIITKRRYLIPLKTVGLTVELDVFEPPLAPLIIAEVEFPDLKRAADFIPPDWFLDDVTHDGRYHNSNLSK